MIEIFIIIFEIYILNALVLLEKERNYILLLNEVVEESTNIYFDRGHE